MTRKQFDEIRPRLLEILLESSPLAPHDLLDKLVKDVSLADSEASNAICRLIDDGDIRLSLDRKFEAAEMAVTQR